MTPSEASSAKGGVPEASLGGADAVPDTPAVDAHGTEPNQKPQGPVRARTRPEPPPRVFAWIGVLVAVAILLIYVAGLFR
jgi:hypothetical protein